MESSVHTSYGNHHSIIIGLLKMTQIQQNFGLVLTSSACKKDIPKRETRKEEIFQN